MDVDCLGLIKKLQILPFIIKSFLLQTSATVTKDSMVEGQFILFVVLLVVSDPLEVANIDCFLITNCLIMPFVVWCELVLILKRKTSHLSCSSYKFAILA